MILQEKHTRGHLWWKITYYKYYRLESGYLLAVPVFPQETIDALERGK